MTDRTMIQNAMSTTNHRFVLHKPNHKVFNWQVQSFELPSVSISQAKITSSPKIGSWSIAGTGVLFDKLSVTFLLDENLSAWQELRDWLDELVAGYEHQPTELLVAESTASIHFTTNQHASLGKIATFRRIYPVTIGAVALDTTTNEPRALTCEVIFQYDDYNLEVVKSDDLITK